MTSPGSYGTAAPPTAYGSSTRSCRTSSWTRRTATRPPCCPAATATSSARCTPRGTATPPGWTRSSPTSSPAATTSPATAPGLHIDAFCSDATFPWGRSDAPLATRRPRLASALRADRRRAASGRTPARPRPAAASPRSACAGRLAAVRRAAGAAAERPGPAGERRPRPVHSDGMGAPKRPRTRPNAEVVIVKGAVALDPEPRTRPRRTRRRDRLPERLTLGDARREPVRRGPPEGAGEHRAALLAFLRHPRPHRTRDRRDHRRSSRRPRRADHDRVNAAVGHSERDRVTVMVWINPGAAWESAVDAAARLGLRRGRPAAGHRACRRARRLAGCSARRATSPARRSRAREDQAAALFDEAEARIGRPVRRLWERGVAEHEVVAAASTTDLLVCVRDGAPGRRGPDSLGPVTRFVVDHAPCRVLLVWPGRPPAGATAARYGARPVWASAACGGPYRRTRRARGAPAAIRAGGQRVRMRSISDAVAAQRDAQPLGVGAPCPRPSGRRGSGGAGRERRSAPRPPRRTARSPAGARPTGRRRTSPFTSRHRRRNRSALGVDEALDVNSSAAVGRAPAPCPAAGSVTVPLVRSLRRYRPFVDRDRRPRRSARLSTGRSRRGRLRPRPGLDGRSS